MFVVLFLYLIFYIIFRIINLFVYIIFKFFKYTFKITFGIISLFVYIIFKFLKYTFKITFGIINLCVYILFKVLKYTFKITFGIINLCVYVLFKFLKYILKIIFGIINLFVYIIFKFLKYTFKITFGIFKLLKYIFKFIIGTNKHKEKYDKKILSQAVNKVFLNNVRKKTARNIFSDTDLNATLSKQLYNYVDNDNERIGCVTRELPFSQKIDAAGIREDSFYTVSAAVEQLNTVMLGSDELEIKLIAGLDALILNPMDTQVITELEEEPLDYNVIKKLPGICGYIVKAGDSLWNIAKKHYTTVERIMELNNLPSENIKPGTKLLITRSIS